MSEKIRVPFLLKSETFLFNPSIIICMFHNKCIVISALAHACVEDIVTRQTSGEPEDEHF